MKLLLYGLNFWPELTGVGKYSGEMAQWLAARGHTVDVVTAPPYYPQWQVQPPHRAGRWAREDWPVRSAAEVPPIRVHRSPLWVPRRVRTLSRLLHLASFALSSLPPLWAALRRRPDALVVVIPTLFSAPLAGTLARWYGVTTWLHVQDFEVDAMFGLGMAGSPARSGRLQRWALAGEAAVLRRYARVSSITPPMVARLHGKGVAPARAVEFPNWVDLDAIRPLADPSPYRAEWGLHADDVLLLYAGNMGEKQGLEAVVDAARALVAQPRLKFVLAGDGSARVRLQQAAAGLPNLRWLPLQPLERLNELLGAADVHLLPQRADAADLVMPSKLIGMLASGRAIVGTAAADTQLGRVLDAVGCRVLPGDVPALVIALQTLADDPGRRARLGQSARAHAEAHLSQQAIMARFESQLQALVDEARPTRIA
jgi:colanic acid biosynthesis glycosyl transferase WcaI